MCQTSPWSSWARARALGRAAAFGEGFVALADATGYRVSLRDAEGRPLGEWTLERKARRLRLVGDGALCVSRCGRVSLFDRRAKEAAVVAEPPGLALDAFVRDDELVVCDRDEKIRVCRFPQTRQTTAVLLGHDDFVSRVEPLPAERSLFASASGDGSVLVWNSREATRPRRFGGERSTAAFALACFGSTAFAARRGEDALDAHSVDSPDGRVKLPAEPTDLISTRGGVGVCFADGGAGEWLVDERAYVERAPPCMRPVDFCEPPDAPPLKKIRQTVF